MMFGRAWFPLDMEELNRAMMTSSFETLFSDKLPSGLAEASELLTQFIEAKAGGSYLLGGFSQGSMMACELSLNSSLKPEALVLLSSTLVAKERFVERLKKAHCLPVFQCHGISDPVLPISMARALKQQFNECAWEVDYHEFTGGHEIPPQALQALVTFLGAIK
jgi:phospholipase/carboxylesterase